MNKLSNRNLKPKLKINFEFNFQKGPQKDKPAQKEKPQGGAKGKNPNVELVKQEGRVRKISERSVPKRVATKTQHTQAELVEPLFTYMRSSVGITDHIQNMGFSTKERLSINKT